VSLPLPFEIPFVAEHIQLSIFLFLLLFGFVIPITEEIALILVGMTIRGSGADIVSCLGVALVALALADMGFYGIARIVGPRLLRVRAFGRFMKPERVLEGERYFQRRGPRIIFFCRFVVGLRAPALLGAGFLRMPLKRFILYDGLALLVSPPVWLGVGYAFGAQLDAETGMIARILSFIGPVAVIVAACLVYRSVTADKARSEAEDKAEGAGEEEPKK
jgi:membrane protein DedA with SNARE-associated domain